MILIHSSGEMLGSTGLPNSLKDIKKTAVLYTGENIRNTATDNLFSFYIIYFLTHAVKIFDFKILSSGNRFINGCSAMHIFHQLPKFLFALLNRLLCPSALYNSSHALSDGVKQRSFFLQEGSFIAFRSLFEI